VVASEAGETASSAEASDFLFRNGAAAAAAAAVVVAATNIQRQLNFRNGSAIKPHSTVGDPSIIGGGAQDGSHHGIGVAFESVKGLDAWKEAAPRDQFLKDNVQIAEKESVVQCIFIIWMNRVLLILHHILQGFNLVLGATDSVGDVGW